MKPKSRLYEERLTEEIIGAVIEVHRQLGPGLLESTYATCMRRELVLRNIRFEHEKPLPNIRGSCSTADIGWIYWSQV